MTDEDLYDLATGPESPDSWYELWTIRRLFE